MNIKPYQIQQTANPNFGKNYQSVNIPNMLLINDSIPSAPKLNNNIKTSAHKYFRLSQNPGRVLLLATFIAGITMAVVGKITQPAREQHQIEYYEKEINKEIEQIKSDILQGLPADTLLLSSELNDNNRGSEE